MNNKELHPYWKALILWAEAHPNSKVSGLKFQNGIPMQVFIQTKDGLGLESILFSEVAKRLNLVK